MSGPHFPLHPVSGVLLHTGGVFRKQQKICPGSFVRGFLLFYAIVLSTANLTCDYLRTVAPALRLDFACSSP